MKTMERNALTSETLALLTASIGLHVILSFMLSRLAGLPSNPATIIATFIASLVIVFKGKTVLKWA